MGGSGTLELKLNKACLSMFMANSNSSLHVHVPLAGHFVLTFLPILLLVIHNFSGVAKGVLLLFPYVTPASKLMG